MSWDARVQTPEEAGFISNTKHQSKTYDGERCVGFKTAIYSRAVPDTGARIFELENEHHWSIEHSKDTDSHGFKSYRIV